MAINSSRTHILQVIPYDLLQVSQLIVANAPMIWYYSPVEWELRQRQL